MLRPFKYLIKMLQFHIRISFGILAKGLDQNEQTGMILGDIQLGVLVEQALHLLIVPGLGERAQSVKIIFIADFFMIA